MTECGDVITRRDASAAIGSFDEDGRTVEVIWAAGGAVKRYSWDEGYYMEELSMDPKHIRLDRFQAGMSLLDSHDASSMESRLGTVLPGSVRISGGKAYATVKLSRKARAEELLQDLRDGHPFPVSVGYRTHAYEKREGDGNQLPTLRAIDWEPMELTACPVPADAGAHSRKEDTAMTTKNRTSFPPLEPTEEDLDSIRMFGPSEKKALVERLGLGDDFYRRHARKDETAFREAMIEEAAVRYEETRTGGFADLVSQRDDPADRIRAMGEALHHRFQPQTGISERAREYVGLPIPELARVCLHARGHATTGMAPSQLVTRALHTTSDFPEILGSAVGRSLRESYEAAPAPIKAVARKTTARDFRAKHAVAFSEAPTLEKVNEHGEFKSGTMKEGRESYKIDTFGKIFGITRQAMVNDDLSAFEQIPAKLGRAAKAFEATFLTDLVQSNPVMGDGAALFHASHKNLASSGTFLSAASLSVARLAMRRQTGLAAELIAVAPKFLIVAPELETEAEKLLAEISAAKSTDVNVFSKLTLIVEPRLSLNSGLTWYLAAGTNEIDGLEYAYLEGNEEPQIETKAGFELDGVQIRVRLDFGAGFVDHRGWYKNPGAVAL